MGTFNPAQVLYPVLWPTFARPITVTPIASQPGAPAFASRGYLYEKETMVMGEDGTVISDKVSHIDLLLADFTVLPIQGDLIDIPFDLGVPGGAYSVLDLAGDGNVGGIIEVTLKSVKDPKPIP